MGGICCEFKAYFLLWVKSVDMKSSMTQNVKYWDDYKFYEIPNSH